MQHLATATPIPTAVPDGLERLAVHIAEAAGRVLLGHFGEPAQDVRAKSGPADLVSRADVDAEALLMRLLERHRPGDGVLGEEGAARPSATGLTWIVDPLDGTANFLSDVPHWAVSVACDDGLGELVGAVHDPVRGETFRAARGGGAHRGRGNRPHRPRLRQPPATGKPPVGGRRQAASPSVAASGTPDERLAGPRRRELRGATITGDFAAPARAAEVAAALFPAVGHVRSLGAAALDLAWVACGRVDAFYHERWFKPWDVAAGALLCREAGLEVDVLRPVGPGLSPRMLAAPPWLMDELRALVS